MPYPVPAGIAVVHDRQVLLVRRSNPPDAGYCRFPSGKINAAESIEQDAIRELLEEIGIEDKAISVLTALDGFSGDAHPSSQQHS